MVLIMSDGRVGVGTTPDLHSTTCTEIWRSRFDLVIVTNGHGFRYNHVILQTLVVMEHW